MALKIVLGYAFKNDTDLSRQLGKYDGYVSQQRQRKRLSYEEIILQSVQKPVLQTVLGYTFKNNSDLSRQLGKCDYYVSFYRNRKGLSYEEIIKQATEKKSSHKTESLEAPLQTVLGYAFKSDSDLSRQLGKTDCYVSLLRRQGHNYEEIINQCINSYQTVLGYTFKNDTDLSRQLGKHDGYVGLLRRQKKKTYEEIIEKAIQKLES